jgi:NTE family protein
VLRVLKESGIPIDALAGCSIGAVAGALYCGGLPFERILNIMQGADRKLTKWTLPIASIWSDVGLKNLLRENGPHVRMSQLRIPFAAVACDIRSGREVALRKGLVWKAVRASVSVPGMFPAALVDGRALADGGLVDPVPSTTARAMGADYVIAVDLMSPSARAKQAARAPSSKNNRRHSRPNLVEMLWRSMEIMQEEITVRSASHADVNIEPELGRARWKDFSLRSAEFVAAGEAAAHAKVDTIRAITGA